MDALHLMTDTTPTTRRPRFTLGRICSTPGALEAMADAGDDPSAFLRRHVCGDWGDLGEEDRQANDAALVEGTRIFSAYHTRDGEKLWVITEWDRSATTILLPSEY